MSARLVIEAFEKGYCFNNARKWAWDHDTADTRVIHGTVVLDSGKRGNHAWVEQGDKVTDPTMGITASKDVYYRMTKAKPEAAYSPEQATINMARSRNHGPWTAAEVENRKLTMESLEAIVYHGERPGGSGITRGSMIYLTPSQETAARYVDADGGKVHTLKLTLQKPLDLRPLGTDCTVDEFNSLLEREGSNYVFGFASVTTWNVL